MTPKKILLKSDFRDYYDHWFCGRWETPDFVFERLASGGMSRSNMFSFLEDSLHLTVPRHGEVNTLIPRLLSDDWDESVRSEIANIFEVVVYLDEYSHRGEGKIKITYQDALDQYPHHLAAEHIPAVASGLGVSFRYLRIGRRQFWLRYRSHDDWRSNCGEVDIDFLCEERPDRTILENVPHPIFAIDFILAGQKMYAIDFNTAPQVRGTGIEQLVAANDIYEEIAASVTGTLSRR